MTMFRRLLGFALLSIAPLVQADQYDDLRLKWKDIMIGVGYNTLDPDVASRLTSIANSANTNWASMDKSPTRTFLWSDLAGATVPSHVNHNYGRLEDMARAYATPGCTLAFTDTGRPTGAARYRMFVSA